MPWIAIEEEVQARTLEKRLREEAARLQSVSMALGLMNVWTRVAGSSTWYFACTTAETAVHAGAAFMRVGSLRRQAWRRRLQMRFLVARLLRATVP